MRSTSGKAAFWGGPWLLLAVLAVLALPPKAEGTDLRDQDKKAGKGEGEKKPDKPRSWPVFTNSGEIDPNTGAVLGRWGRKSEFEGEVIKNYTRTAARRFPGFHGLGLPFLSEKMECARLWGKILLAAMGLRVVDTCAASRMSPSHSRIQLGNMTSILETASRAHLGPSLPRNFLFPIEPMAVSELLHIANTRDA